MEALMSKKLIQLSAAALLALGMAVGSASAYTEELVSPTGVDSGWAANYNDSLTPQLNLVYKGMVGNDFFIEKDATFNANDMGGLEITFTKTNSNADTLVINDESIINNSGVSWSGFNFELGTGSTGGTPGFAFANTSGSSIGTGANDFDISPFTSFAFSSNNTILSMTGGTIANGAVWMPGATSQSGLAIVASGDGESSFVLKEIPNAIPLPAAAWTGLSTLIGLGLVGVAKNARKLLA
jgi:hypothetical protein